MPINTCKISTVVVGEIEITSWKHKLIMFIDLWQIKPNKKKDYIKKAQIDYVHRSMTDKTKEKERKSNQIKRKNPKEKNK
jgi:hypothetical protein